MKEHFLIDGLTKPNHSCSKRCKQSSRATLLTISPSNQPDTVNHQAMPPNAGKTLTFVCFICLVFMLIEFIGGLLSNSLAVMTDAAHLLSDLTGFLISIYALQISTKAPTAYFTFGFHRAEIVGAVTSIFLMWILTAILFVEAMTRLFHFHHVIKGGLMVSTASIGLVFNVIMAYVLHSSADGRQHHNHHGRPNGRDALRSLLKKKSHSPVPCDNNHHDYQDKPEDLSPDSEQTNLVAVKASQNNNENEKVILEDDNEDKTSTYGNSKSKNNIRNCLTEMNIIHSIEKHPKQQQYLISNLDCNKYRSPQQIRQLISKEESVAINRTIQSDFDMKDNGSPHKRKSEDISLKKAKLPYRNFDLASPRISKQHLTRDFSKFAKLGAFIGLKEEDRESNSSFGSEDNKSDSFYTISVNNSSKDVNQSLGISPNKSINTLLRHSHSHSHGHSSNDTTPSSFIHIIGDAIQSIGVLIAASLIYFFPSYQIIDPLATILFSLIVIATTLPIIRQCAYVIMEGSANVEDFTEIKNELINTPGVISVSCLHLCYLSLDKAVLCGHIKVIQSVNECELLKRINEELGKYKLYHCTIEISKEDSATCSNMMDIY